MDVELGRRQLLCSAKKHAADSMRPAAMFNVYLGLGASFYTRNLIRAHCSIMGAARLKSEE